MTKEQELTALLEEGQSFSTLDFVHISSADKIRVEVWFGKVNMFAKNRLSDNEMKKEFTDAYFFKDTKRLKATYERMTALLLTLVSYLTTDHEGANMENTPKALNSPAKKYDVFISHASKDKVAFVDDLYNVIKRLGISVFYDTDVFSWGDNWKQLIYDGTAQSEFAIIVISENFFDREWTEIELKEFLQRQNASGQKIILPLLYNISFDDLNNKYPSLSDIQCLKVGDYSKEEICILFAKELIKRLKGIQ